MIRKSVDAQAIGLMTLLCMTWGMQQVSIKLAAEDIASVMQIALRSGLAVVLLTLFMLWRRDSLSLRENWKPGLLAGLLFSAEFFFVAEGLRFTSASHISIFVYSAPIFAALGLHIKLPAERLNGIQWAGILLAFCGIAITFLGREDGGSAGLDASDMIIGDLLGLLAGLSWGATTVVIRCSNLSSSPASQTLMYQLLVCFVLVLAAAIFSDRAAINWTTVATSSLLFQAVIICFISFLTWFWLLGKYVASQLGVFSFMTPLFGMLFGVLILDESLEQGFIFGAALVMSGILLVSGQSVIRRYFSTLTGKKAVDHKR
ncbi:DMT family transporter [Marinobacterium jannaschii]|uniref:DMT family transporter n=1 Tax=Marinobacterium jannaschii TaxID=64970 RepID=UPI000688FC30|nr:DMT family transporter [Marinobacterium jannaschii]